MAEPEQTSDKIYIGLRLTRERVRLGLGVSEVARIAQCSRRVWQYYEQGRCAPGSIVLGLLDAAGFDVVYIVAGRLGRPLRPH
ncbi:TPA: helix-turn-helix domain-containing protein [Pseudomonas aeruginosa]